MCVYLEMAGLEDTCLLGVGCDTFCEEGSENIQMNQPFSFFEDVSVSCDPPKPCKQR